MTLLHNRAGHKFRQPLAAVGPGGPVGTGSAEALRAQMIEIQSLKEVQGLGRNALKGKIVFFDRPIDPTVLRPARGVRGRSQLYFDYHHTSIDPVDKVNPRELKLGAAALAALIYLVDTQGL